MIGFTFFVVNNISSHPATSLSLFSDVRRVEKIVKKSHFFLECKKIFYILCNLRKVGRTHRIVPSCCPQYHLLWYFPMLLNRSGSR
jgi:hypothetical protein